MNQDDTSETNKKEKQSHTIFWIVMGAILAITFLGTIILSSAKSRTGVLVFGSLLFISGIISISFACYYSSRNKLHRQAMEPIIYKKGTKVLIKQRGTIDRGISGTIVEDDGETIVAEVIIRGFSRLKRFKKKKFWITSY